MQALRPRWRTPPSCACCFCWPCAEVPGFAVPALAATAPAPAAALATASPAAVAAAAPATASPAAPATASPAAVAAACALLGRRHGPPGGQRAR